MKEKLFKELADLLEENFEKEFEGIEFQLTNGKQKQLEQYFLFQIGRYRYFLSDNEDGTYMFDCLDMGNRPTSKWLDISDQIGTILESVKQIIGD